MTEQVTVKTGFKKLPDSDALALALRRSPGVTR